MTRDQDIERVLERWFTEGPTQMPDRLFEFVDHIDRLPQRRRARLTRFVAMNPTLRIAAAAVVILVVAGAGTIFLTRPSGVGTEPSPTPSVAPSVSVPPTPIPESLRSQWLFTGARPAPGSDSRLTIGASTLEIDRVDGMVVFSASLADDGDLLTLRSLNEGVDGCLAGDAGTYAFSVSSDGNTLTLTPANDACSVRSGALAGEWARVACVAADGGCLGNLAPGTYSSGLFNALSSSSSGYDYGQFSYTVPAGWTNTQDWQGNYNLHRLGDPVDTGIYLFRDVVPHVQGDDSCLAAEEPDAVADEPGVGRTPAAFAEWLSNLPGLVATEPVAVTIGGLDGFMIDLSVDPAWTHTCPYSNGGPMVSTFVDSVPGPGYDWTVGGNGPSQNSHVRYIFLAQPDGNSLLIDIEASDGAAWEALVAEAMPIVDSFQFSP